MAQNQAPTERMLNDEFIRGFDCGQHGSDPSACPFTEDGPLRKAWRQGFDLAVRIPVVRMRLPLDRRAA